MKVLWIILVVATLEVPTLQPLYEECRNRGGVIHILNAVSYVSTIRCVKYIKEKNENKEPERVPNTYSTG